MVIEEIIVFHYDEEIITNDYDELDFIASMFRSIRKTFPLMKKKTYLRLYVYINLLYVRKQLNITVFFMKSQRYSESFRSKRKSYWCDKIVPKFLFGSSKKSVI